MNDQQVAEPARWSEIARLAAIASFLLAVGAPFAFWLGVQLTAIESAVASVQSDVSEIKGSVHAHIARPAHPVAAEQLRAIAAKLANK